jgi:hypothetical protein
MSKSVEVENAYLRKLVVAYERDLADYKRRLEFQSAMICDFEQAYYDAILKLDKLREERRNEQ